MNKKEVIEVDHFVYSRRTDVPQEDGMYAVCASSFTETGIALGSLRTRIAEPKKGDITADSAFNAYATWSSSLSGTTYITVSHFAVLKQKTARLRDELFYVPGHHLVLGMEQFQQLDGTLYALYGDLKLKSFPRLYKEIEVLDKCAVSIGGKNATTRLKELLDKHKEHWNRLYRVLYGIFNPPLYVTGCDLSPEDRREICEIVQLLLPLDLRPYVTYTTAVLGNLKPHDPGPMIRFVNCDARQPDFYSGQCTQFLWKDNKIKEHGGSVISNAACRYAQDVLQKAVNEDNWGLVSDLQRELHFAVPFSKPGQVDWEFAAEDLLDEWARYRPRSYAGAASPKVARDWLQLNDQLQMLPSDVQDAMATVLVWLLRKQVAKRVLPSDAVMFVLDKLPVVDIDKTCLEPQFANMVSTAPDAAFEMISGWLAQPEMTVEQQERLLTLALFALDKTTDEQACLGALRRLRDEVTHQVEIQRHKQRLEVFRFLLQRLTTAERVKLYAAELLDMKSHDVQDIETMLSFLPTAIVSSRFPQTVALIGYLIQNALPFNVDYKKIYDELEDLDAALSLFRQAIESRYANWLIDTNVVWLCSVAHDKSLPEDQRHTLQILIKETLERQDYEHLGNARPYWLLYLAVWNKATANIVSDLYAAWINHEIELFKRQLSSSFVDKVQELLELGYGFTPDQKLLQLLFFKIETAAEFLDVYERLLQDKVVSWLSEFLTLAPTAMGAYRADKEDKFVHVVITLAQQDNTTVQTSKGATRSNVRTCDTLMKWFDLYAIGDNQDMVGLSLVIAVDRLLHSEDYLREIDNQAGQVSLRSHLNFLWDNGTPDDRLALLGSPPMLSGAINANRQVVSWVSDKLLDDPETMRLAVQPLCAQLSLSGFTVCAKFMWSYFADGEAAEGEAQLSISELENELNNLVLVYRFLQFGADRKVSSLVNDVNVDWLKRAIGANPLLEGQLTDAVQWIVPPDPPDHQGLGATQIDAEEIEMASNEGGSYDFTFGGKNQGTDRPTLNARSQQIERDDTENSTQKNIEVDPNRIGLWGTVSSGKTTFLGVLYHVLLESAEWQISSNSEAADDFIEAMHKRIFTNRMFPVPTPEGVVNTLDYILNREIGPDEAEEFTLSFIDASGESFRDPKKWKAEHPDKESPLDILKTCGKIICLLDAEPFLPSRKKFASGQDRPPVSLDEYFTDFHYFFKELVSQDRRTGKLKVGRTTSYKIAFCLSKCDLPMIWEQRRDVRPFAERIFKKTVIAQIGNFVHRDNYFWSAFSAVGPYSGDGNEVSPVTDEGVIRPDHEIEPWGVVEIIAALLNKPPIIQE